MSESDSHTHEKAHASTHETELLWKLIRTTRFAMFTTRHGNGHLHSRPMTTQNRKEDEDDCLWFFMSRKGDPVEDLTKEPGVNVAYANTGDDTYVSVSGDASVVDDTALKQRLWSPMTQAWFPGGPTDADVALVRVRITHANYWNVTDSKATQIFKMAKAAVTGKVPTDMGESGEVRLN